MKKLNKNKFIIGLSTTVMGGILATGQAAYASNAPVIDEHTNTTKVIDNTYVDYTIVDDNEIEKDSTTTNAIVDGNKPAGVETTTTSDDSKDSSVGKDIELDQEAVAEEQDSNQESNQTLTEANDLTSEDKADTTNETEHRDTAENTDQATEASSEEEALLTEPTANTEDPAAVDEAEEPSTETTAEEDTQPETDQNLDVEVEAGAVVENTADTASTEADPVDEDFTEKAQELEANTEDTTNKEVAAATNTEQKDDANESADTPQETPAGDEPKEDPEAGDAPREEDVLPLTEGGSELPETEEGATLSLTSEGAELPEIQTLAAGDAPIDGDSLLTEQGNEPPETDKGAESPSGDVNIAVRKGYTDPEADAAKIKNSRETNLTSGDTVESGGKNDFVDPKDGFKAIVIEPKNDSKDKRLYGYELIIDKKTGQRTYTRIEASSSVVRTSPANVGNKPMMGVGDKLSEDSPEVTYKATGTSTLTSGSQNVYGYRASEEDLMHINNKDNDFTVLGMKDYYTKDNAYGPQVLAGVNVVFNVNPWPDENDNLERIRLQDNYDENKKVYVHGQEIDTGLKVENLDANARDRLTAKVYNPENGEIVPEAEVYIDGEGNVKVKLPDGAVDKSGNINKKSIFYDDPKFNGAQSLDVKLYARPRKAEEFQNVANLSWFAPGTYTDTGAGTTTITHKGEAVTIANQGIDRYDHYNLIGEFEIKLDDESNYDIITKDLTTNKIVTDKMLRLKAGVNKEVKQVDNPNSDAPHKYTTAKDDKAVDSYLEPEYKDFLTPVEGEVNKYRTKDNWLVEVDPDNPQNIKVSTPIGAKKGENVTLPVTYLFTNGSEKNFLMNFVVNEESIEKPNYKVAVTEAGEEVTNTPTNEYTETKPKPVKYELESTSIVDDNGKTWTLSIDENSGVITATAPGEIKDKVSTINAPVIATYVDQKLKDKDGKDLVYTEKSNATFTATAPQEGEVTYSQDNTIEYETIVKYNPEKDPTQSGIIQEGKNGKYTADYKVTYKDGEVVEGPTMVEGSERDRVEPIPQIFEIGTKGASVDVTAPAEQTIKIPHTTDVTYDDTKPLGYREETPGEDGEKKITYEITQENGKATVKATESTTKEVTPRKIVIGTKPIEDSTSEFTENKVSADNVKINYVPDPNMKLGETKDGEVTGGEIKTVVTTKYNPETGKVETTEETTVTPITKTVYTGTQDFTGTINHTENHEEAFEVEYVYTDELNAGETKRIQEGKKGTYTVTYTHYIKNGEEVDKDGNKVTADFKAESVRTDGDAPQKEIIKIGTKPVQEVVEIPFDTEYIYDNTIAAGTTKTDKEGVVGYKKLVTTYDENNKTSVTTVADEKAAENKIVRVGGKTTGKEVITEDIAFNTRVEYDPSLKKGEWKYKVVDGVEQKGVAGERKITVNIENSVATSTTEQVTAPVDAVILVGSEDFTGKISHEVTEEVPFTVRIVEDSTMAPGTSRVETKGQAGSKTTRYTQNIVNGAADGELKSEEIVTATTKAPVEEVIHVGTAAVNSENTATSGDIPVDITYTYDSTKERGTAEKGAFTPGKVETKIVNQYNPKTGKIETKTEETVTNAKQEIIVGTKDYTGTFTHEERKVTPFETQIVHDPNLKAGETVTDQTGVNGVETRTITQKFTNGEIAEKSYSDWTSESKVQNEIIRVGSLTEGTKKHEEAIPFDYKVEYDPTIPAGEYKITQEGKDGKRTTEWTIKNSQVVGEPTVTEEAPVNAIIKVGNKDFTGVATHTESFTIPYKVVIRENPDLPVGSRKTIQEGTDGSYKITYKQDIKNGDTVGELTRTESDRVEAQNQIIEVGSKPVDAVKEGINKEVKVTVEYRPDPNLPKGQTRTGELTPGKVEHIVTTTFDPASGKMINSVEERTTDAKQIIYVGAQDLTGPYTYEIEKTVPFKTEYVDDPNLEAGKQRLEQAGEDGIKIITVTGTVVDGEVKNSANSERITKDPVTQIIRVGTKANVANTTVTHEENRTIEYTTEIKYDDTLPVGTRNVIQEGINGESKFTYTTDVVDGKPGETKVSETVITPVQKEIILVGTKEAQNVNEEYTEAIPYETKIIYDDSKPLGYKEETAGTAGSRKVTITSEIVNGEIKTTRNEEVITQATDKTVVIGTKPIEKSLEYIDKSIDNVEIEIVNDPTLAKGTVIEGDITPGRTYSVVESVYNKETGEIDSVERTIIIPPKRTITVGTKDYTGTFEHGEVEITPYKTIIQTNPNLKAGEKEVTQKGINGRKERTVTQSFVNGEKGEKSYSDWTVVDTPQNEIITVGTMTEGTNKYEEEIPFKYVVDHDPDLKAGEIRVEKAGKVGKRTVEWTVKNSEVVGNPVTTVIEAAEDAIIKVGNKDYTGTATHTEDFIIPYKVVIRENPELPVGTRNTVQEGTDGSYKITYKQDIKNGDTVGELTRTESDRVEAKDQIIEIGTKAIEPKVDNYSYEVQPEIDYVYDDTLPKGTVEKGKTTPGGVKTVITTTRDPQTGELVTKEEKVVTPARQEIRVGTKDYTGEIKYTERVYEDYKTTIIQDPNLAADQQVVEKQGVVGIKEREVTRTITNGTASDPSYGDYTTIAEKQDQVIRVGTKTDGTHTVTEELPFTYTINEVDTLKKGEYEVVTAGKNGSRTTEYRIENSKVVEGSANVKEETKPTNAVINVGKGTLNGTHTITETEVVPFETEIVFDDTLKAGEQVVSKEGSNGSKSREVTLTIEDGKVVKTETGEYEEKQAPVNKVIKVGSLTEGEVVHEEKIPFNYEITYDDTLKAGEVVTDVAGVEGTKSTTYVIKNSKVTNEYTNTTNPTNAKIRVGIKDYTGTVTHTTTEPIAYKVVVRNNPDMLLGTSKTVTEGVAGSKEVTYNIPVVNGEQDTTTEVTSSEKVITAAIDQVIEVGTKPVEAVEKDVSAEVGVEVELRNDENLDLGKTRVGELTEGKVENVVTTVYNPATGKMETREDKVVTPAKQIIYVGTKDLVGDQEFVVTQPVPFETEYIEDSNLEAGKTEIEQQGQNGQKTVTYKAEAKNGTVTKNKVTEEITTPPTKQIIRVGTKSEETDTKVVVESIPFEIKYEYTDELDAGKIEVVEEGELGEKTTTTTTTTINGVETTDIKEETTKEAVNRIVRVGTKIDRQTTDVVGEETTIIPYKTTVIYDPNLKAGEKVVDKVGVNGERKITVTVPVVDGVAKDPVVKTEDTVQAQDEIIRVGTRDDSTTTVLNTTTTTESIAFTTRYVEDENLDIGKTVVETPGQFGSKTVTTSTILINGEAKTSTSDNVTKNPVEQVVRVGTKVPKLDNQTVTETKDIEVPYSTIIQYNNQMDVGSSFVAQEGTNGTTTITTTVDVVDGVAGKPVITTTTNDPKTRIVQVGTRPVTEIVKSAVEFETEVIFDDTLPIGEERVEKGELGEDTTTITHELVDGKIVASTDTTRTKEPKKQIVRVGTKPAEFADQDIEDTRTIEIPYTTRIVYDDTLPAGTERVDQEGKNGKRVITYKVEVRDGIATDAEIVDETTTDPKERVIRVGTRRTDTITTVVETVKPFETKIVYDPEMPKGTSEVTQEGKNGIKRETIVSTRINGIDQENPAVTVSETDAIDQIITVGTKCDDQVATIDTEVEKVTPYEVEIVYDDTLAKGEEVVLREGQNGIVKETHTVTVTNGVAGESTITKTEKIQDKVNKIIRVGTKTTTPSTPETPKPETKNVVSSTTVSIPFTTRVTYDPSLEAGRVEEISAGQNGEETVTTTVKIVDGKASDPIVERKVTKKAVDRVIVVGTKAKTNETPDGESKEIVTSKEVEIPYGTQIIYDDTLDAGQVVEVKAGQNGVRTVTTTVILKNGIASEPITTSSTTKVAVDRIIKVGTKSKGPNNPIVDNRDVVSSKVVEIPYTTEIIYDSTLKAGTIVEDQAGIAGERIITTTITIINGIAGEPVVSEEVTKQPVKRIIRVGTKSVTEVNDKTTIIKKTVEPIPYETLYISDNDLEVGKEIIVVKGYEGEKVVTTITKIVNGKEVVETSEEVTKAPRNRIVRIGTKVPENNQVDPEEPNNPITPNKPEQPISPVNPVYPNTPVIPEIPVEPITPPTNEVVVPGDDTGIDELIDELVNFKSEVSLDTEVPEDDETPSKDTPETNTDDNDEKSNIGRDVDEEHVSDLEKSKITRDTEEDDAQEAGKKDSKISDNPKTGVASSTGIMSILGLSVAGLAASKKKKDEDEDK